MRTYFPCRRCDRGLVGLVLLATLLACDVHAEPPPVDEAASDQDTPAADDDGMETVLVPLIAYTPETSLLASVIGMQFSDPPESNDEWRATIAGAYTLKNQTLATVNFTTRLDEDTIRLGAGVSAANWPEEYFGTGRGVSLASEELETLRASVKLSALHRVTSQPLYLGLTHEAEVRDVASPAGGLLARTRPEGRGTSTRMGVGLRLLFDSRDQPMGARRGWYARADSVFFQNLWGSSFDYARLRLETRAFLPLDGHILAGRITAHAALGNPPFYDLPALGGSNLMRGIFAGRFRDRRMAAAQGEYRSPLLIWRLSAVAFGSLGVLGPSLDEIALDHAKWATGGGVRLLLSRKRNLNLRLDYGVSEDDHGFYLSIGEAF